MLSIHFFHGNRKYTGITVHQSWQQVPTMRNDSEPLKQMGRCKVFLVFERRGDVAFASSIQGVEDKIFCNRLNRVPKVTTDKKVIDSTTKVQRAEQTMELNKETLVQKPLERKKPNRTRKAIKHSESYQQNL